MASLGQNRGVQDCILPRLAPEYGRHLL